MKGVLKIADLKSATYPAFWECECENNYIHPQLNDSDVCPRCKMSADESPDLRAKVIAESLIYLVVTPKSTAESAEPYKVKTVYEFHPDHGYVFELQSLITAKTNSEPNVKLVPATDIAAFILPETWGGSTCLKVSRIPKKRRTAYGHKY